jgi:hypothetical protein
LHRLTDQTELDDPPAENFSRPPAGTMQSCNHAAEISS